MPFQSRRQLLTNAALAGAASLGGLGAWGKALAAEPPPEVTTVRFEKDPATCIAPQAFQELLRAEGFTDIRQIALVSSSSLSVAILSAALPEPATGTTSLKRRSEISQ